MAQALSDALDLAMAHPDEIGYPWIDPSTNNLVLSAATDEGAALFVDSPVSSGVGTTTRAVDHSFGELARIRYEITQLADLGVPGAEFIYQLIPDHKYNRITIKVSEIHDPLLQYLAEHFPVNALAIQVDPANAEAWTSSRQVDTSPFRGGAKIGTPNAICSTAFSWYTGSSDAMLTAAHCIPSGGSVSNGNGSQYMGWVSASNEENWSTSSGTTYYTGQSVYRGDVAMIRITATRSSTGVMYRGAYNSNTTSNVKAMWERYAAVGDPFITGGQTTGEISGGQVTYVGIDRYYVNVGRWARNVVDGLLPSSIEDGDSGGSVFTTVTGGVKAKGILSGRGLCISGCPTYWTDIRVSFFGLPGSLKTN